jgi:hypothetical protein
MTEVTRKQGRRERKHETNQRKILQIICYSPNPFRGLTSIDEIKSMSDIQIHKVQFLAFSITYYL